MGDFGLIGGTGLEQLPAGLRAEPLTVQTRFGATTVWRAPMGAHHVAFISRHGEKHSTAPHEVNYRANVAALASLGVRRVMATNAAGSLRPALAPGTLVLLDDFIDFTKSRPATFGDASGGVLHTDFSVPYCPALRRAILDAADRAEVSVRPRGVYLCTEGPRFETPAEVRLFAAWGADVVGMTGLPEAILAREAGLCYAAVAIVTNWAAGLTEKPVSHDDVAARMSAQAETVRELLMAAAPLVGPCRCHG